MRKNQKNATGSERERDEEEGGRERERRKEREIGKGKTKREEQSSPEVLIKQNETKGRKSIAQCYCER